MKWNKVPAHVVLTGLFLAAGDRPAAANAAPDCAPAPVTTDANVRRRWPDLREQIQQAFEQRDNVDACARIDVTITGMAVIVKVTLPDGRTAARSVLRREDVLPALEALLLLPESGAVAAPAAATSAAGTSAKPARVERRDRIAATVTIRPQEPPAPLADGGTHLRLELGIGVEARAGDGQMGAGVGVASYLELAHWLLGFQARIDSYRMITGGTSMSGASGSMALELDVLAGRRFALGTTALDLIAGPALAMHGNVRVSAPAGSTTAMSPAPDQQGLPRLVVSSRLTFRAHAAVRTFVQLDAEIGRQRSATQPVPDQADLPAWTAGLTIGATVGTR